MQVQSEGVSLLAGEIAHQSLKNACLSSLYTHMEFAAAAAGPRLPYRTAANYRVALHRASCIAEQQSGPEWSSPVNSARLANGQQHCSVWYALMNCRVEACERACTRASSLLVWGGRKARNTTQVGLPSAGAAGQASGESANGHRMRAYSNHKSPISGGASSSAVDGTRLVLAGITATIAHRASHL